MRSQLINLMLELQEKQGISYIYVTQHGHDETHQRPVLVMHQEKWSSAAVPLTYWPPAP